MTDHPIATPGDPEGYRAVVETVRRLAGHQAISLDEAFRLLLDGQGDPDLMPAHVRGVLCEALRENGYREQWVVPAASDEARLMWTRGPWPIDHGALRGAEVEHLRRA